MRIVYLGTPEFAVPSLRAVVDSRHQVSAVVTAPDRPRGRGHKPRPTAVAKWARDAGLPVLTPKNAASPDVARELRSLSPDALVLVAFGQLIPKTLLDLPPLGCINVHPSLLPRYRGAAPIHAALLAGDRETGVTTMFMDEGLDTGDIALQRRVSIGPSEHAGDLHERLAEVGAELLVATLEQLERGDIRRMPQDEALATYAAKVNKEPVDWAKPAAVVADRIRGLSPYPGTHTHYDGVRVKLIRAEPGSRTSDSERPGSVVAALREGLLVSTRPGAVLVTEVQPEGKAVMPASDFARGYRVRPGDVLS